MANKKKKVIEEVEVVETPIIEESVEEITEEPVVEETVEEEIIAEEAKEDIIESDEGNIEDSVEEGEPEKIDEDVIVEDEPEIIPIVKVPTEDNTVVYQEAKKECKVLLATPSYYIINKNGSNITIYGSNDKKRGDTVEF